MSARVVCAVFALLLLCEPNMLCGDLLAMGSKGGEVNAPNKENGAERTEQKSGKSEDGLSSQGTGSGKSAPAKKPRLKYRDQEKCSC
jgi:hypothetical protein